VLLLLLHHRPSQNGQLLQPLRGCDCSLLLLLQRCGMVPMLRWELLYRLLLLICKSMQPIKQHASRVAVGAPKSVILLRYINTLSII
jgi:hypothetical protein